jgi:nucleoside-diphosphate-sugar epimerase
VREALEFARASSGRNLRPVTVLSGDLCEPGSLLTTADHAWLGRNCARAVHAAASLSFKRTPNGDPQRTNVAATRRLIESCAAWGVREVHHVSTAFVCGDRTGPIHEADGDVGQEFHNEYEQSKLAAEQFVRTFPGLRATIYRPAVIVGDSRTGHTSSYHGVYRFLELADRLAQPGADVGRRWLPLRLPFTGEAPRNLVPVDWVSAAITQIVGREAFHGRTFHLTADYPTRAADLAAVAIEELGIGGVELAGPVPDPTPIERMFLAGLRDYWPYLGGDPVFDRGNVRAALPDLPVPRIDRECLRRLVRFAVADGWGKRRRSPRVPALDCARYIEQFFPQAMERSPLAQVGIEVTLGFDIRGTGGGRWVCRFGGGRVLSAERDATTPVDVEYRMAAATFAAVVSGRESAQAAFTGRRIEIAGSVEQGLKLAVLFGLFVQEFPYHEFGDREFSGRELPDGAPAAVGGPV